MKSTEIREAFLEFFREKGHTVVPGSSLVPANDPTLLFNNAGMNQFKDVFLGLEKRDYTKATSAQRCVRAGGKHNDLENVGYTARHHTFFEMMGNFSFGDYFKREAIQYAWEFLTVRLGLPAERLWVTVYKDDDEAMDIWLKEIGVSAERMSRLGEKDNFWTMGEVGPCGPCSEIFYDHGEDIAGDPPGGPNDDGDRYVEIWNLVFMQFNRTADGQLHPLPSPSIDTGMGLERIAAVMQGVHSNYEIDSFQHILKLASRIAGGVDTKNSSLRVIADHIRATAFLIADGVLPANEGRGYALRRIIRRACRHGYKLGIEGPFFYRLLPGVIEAMGTAAGMVASRKDFISKEIKQEEIRFGKTLERGMKLLEADILQMDNTVLSGKTIFTLYDTYGFPVDLTNDIARERGLSLDMKGYETCMDEQRRKARAASRFSMDDHSGISEEGRTDFSGYDCLEDEGNVVAIYQDGKKLEHIEGEGQQAVLIMDRTPFYAESGGQVGDEGRGVASGNGNTVFEVYDTKKSGDHHLHYIRLVKGSIGPGQSFHLAVKNADRKQTAANHSATHLLHAALQKVLGSHVQQKGSLVNPEKLRFDFSHQEALTSEQLEKIQSMVNAQIRNNTPVISREMDMDTALEQGAMALFGEKYGETVRVLKMGSDDFSMELCGGTHVNRTGDIGFFVIVSESGIASGVRRIEALTGEAAIRWVMTGQARLDEVASLVKGSAANVREKVQALMEQVRQFEQEKNRLQQKLAGLTGNTLAEQAVKVKGASVLAVSLGSGDGKALRETVDHLKNRLEPCVVVLAIESKGKIALAAGVSQSLTGKIKAGTLLQHVALQVKGKGGGRPDFAQGGGSDLAALPAALDSVCSWVEERL